MSIPAQGTELEQLTKTVSDLAAALAHSERRHAHLARSLRWGALILVTLLVGGTALLVDRFGAVYAQQSAIPEASDAVSALNRINQNLALFGMMGETLQSAVPAIEKAMMENPDVQKSVQIYLQAQGIEPTQDNMMAYAAPAITHSAVTTMVDAVVLMQRIRDDSNKFRDLVGGPGPATARLGARASSDECGAGLGARHDRADGSHEPQHGHHVLQYRLDHGPDGELDPLDA